MATGTSFPLRTSSPLTGTLASPEGGQIDRDDVFRRYRAGVHMLVPDNGSHSAYARSIFYEVGRRYSRARDLLAYHPEAAIPIDASVDINAAEASNFEGVARRYSNFSPQWVKMDLAGMVERLAKGVAAKSIYGAIDSTALRGGQPLRVTALGTLDSPQTASINSVFIPRTVDTVGNDSVFAVLVAAANGEGAAVTTDVLRIDANTNQPIVPAVSGAPFATACVEALRILGANMEASGAGDVFAYAVTRGIHASVSVVAHTDEGGLLRGLFRFDRFRVPYGGINQGLRHYPALPALASGSAPAVAAWVDGIALKTAAAVAHCDPLVPGDGGWYPSIFVSRHGDSFRPGTDEAGVDDKDGASVGRAIAADLGRFTPLYSRALVRIFGLSTNSGVAESHMATVGARFLGQTGADVDRHLLHKTVAPYFWVEPTSLLEVNAFGTAAEAEGYGAKVTPGEAATQPCFERFRSLAVGSSATYATVAFKMRTARTSALVSAYAAAPGPLADIRLYQFDEDSVALPGDEGPTHGAVADKHSVADPLSSYLWRRGQSCFPAPAEFVNTNAMYGAKIRLMTWDDDFNGDISDLPSEAELATGHITFRTSVPTGIKPGPSNYADRNAKRARTRAASALAQAVTRSRAFGLAVSPSMEVSCVPPSFDDGPGVYRDSEHAHQGSDGGPTTIRAAGAPPAQTAPQLGAALPPTAFHDAQKAPRLPPQGPVGGGAGGTAPPAAPPAGAAARGTRDAAPPGAAPHSSAPAGGAMLDPLPTHPLDADAADAPADPAQ